MQGHGLSIAIFVLLPALAAAAPSPREEEQRCLEAAARRYSLPPLLLAAVRWQEGGRAGGWRRNADGSFDYGAMQINSRWLPRLAPSGYTATALAYDTCANINVGAWILAQQLLAHRSWRPTKADPRAYWAAVGDYHSRTPTLNRSYAAQVWARYQQLSGSQR